MSNPSRVGLVILLVATATPYLRNVTIKGMGNQYYAASAQAGSQDWKRCCSARRTRTTSSPSRSRHFHAINVGAVTAFDLLAPKPSPNEAP